MLHLIQSNKMERLVDALSVNMVGCGASVLAQTTVLVQSPGMAQWLNIKLAEKLGIAANIAFPLPSSFIWRLYQSCVPDLVDESAFTKANMVWKIMAILPPLLEQPEFAPLKAYLPTEEQQQTKLYQLCAKIADVFDQYLVYRSDWIAQWEVNDDVDQNVISEHFEWQVILWQRLVEYTQQLSESPYHRANLHEALIQHLTVDNLDANNQDLHVFGISAIPDQQLDVLKSYSKAREVYIYWLNPCEHYWADIVTEKYQSMLALAVHEKRLPESAVEYIEVGNSLLSAWGGLGRNYQDRLLDVVDQQVDLFVDTPVNTLLSAVQNQILTLSPTEEGAFSDSSIQCHVCHSKFRELEVLKDQLLHQFEQDPLLTPNDVIVMMPDVAQYASLIDGVFGVNNSEVSIPYAISDKTLRQDSPLVEGFIQLLNLHISRLTLHEVLHLIQIPPITARFDLTAQEIDEVSHWLTQANVSWGLSGQHKAQKELPQHWQNTWLFGVLRLLSGFSMQTENPIWLDDLGYVLPYQQIEGQQGVALGKFYLFIAQLAKYAGLFSSPLDLLEKEQQTLALIDAFFLVDEEQQWEINELVERVNSLRAHQWQFPEQIEHSVYVTELVGRIEEKGVGQRFLAGSVNFCTLMPMRSIPFKVVCLLGMNDQDYPRYVEPVSFDLIHLSKGRKGDRSRRQDDRYLFLEALISARQMFYVSYIGRSVQDNSELTPSLLVNELLNYCQGQFDAQSASSSLIIEHPLHPYNVSYFDKDEPYLPPSYSQLWGTVANASTDEVVQPKFWQSTQTEVTEEPIELDIAELCRFYANTSAAFFRAKWQTQFVAPEQKDDAEPFILSPLARYKVIQQWQDQQSEVNEHNYQRLQGEGVMPIGQLAQVSFLNTQHDAKGFMQSLAELPTTHQRIEISVNLSHGHIVGWCDEVFSGHLVLARPGKIRTRDKFQLWLIWLSLCASKPQGVDLQQARFVGLSDTFVLPLVLQEEAQQLLSEYVKAYQLGLLSPLCFFPETGWNWLKYEDKEKALQIFSGNDKQKGEGQELHAYRLFNDLDEQFLTLIKVSQWLLGPLFEHCEGSK